MCFVLDGIVEIASACHCLWLWIQAPLYWMTMSDVQLFAWSWGVVVSN